MNFKQVFFKYTAIFFGLMLICLTVSAQKPRYATGIVVVKMKESTSKSNSSVEQIALQYGTPICINQMFDSPSKSSSNSLNRIFKIQFNATDNVEKIASLFAENNQVEYATPYWLPELFATIDDPGAKSQYYLNTMQVIDAWDITQGDTNMVIGIVDTGIDFYHADLVDNIKYNYNDPLNGIDDDLDGFVDNFRGWDTGCNDNNPQNSREGHGTFVSGIASATANNGIGIAGVGNKCKFLPIKASNENGDLSGCWEGIVYAADHGCKVINCSWGSTVKNPLCDDVVNYARNSGCLIVAACGNSRICEAYYPAACQGVISVAAVNSADIKWQGSTYHHTVDVSAPGDGVYTTKINNSYQLTYGTSFAAPCVAGAAALAWTTHAHYTADQIAELLRVTADRIDTLPSNSEYIDMLGSGRINVFKAVSGTTLPSVRIVDSQISGSDKFKPNSELNISLTICNYLNKARHLSLTLNNNNGYTVVGNNKQQISQLNELDSAPNIQFKILIDSAVTANQNINLDFTFTDGAYSAKQIIQTQVNQSFINISSRNFETTIADNGKIGHYNNLHQGCGFLYKKSNNVISDGGILVALNDTYIASSVQNDNQFECISQPDSVRIADSLFVKSTIKPTTISDLIIKQTFQIIDNQPNALFCIYKLINSGKFEITDAKVALFFDFDVTNSLTNSEIYKADKKLVGVFDNKQNSAIASVALLSNHNAVAYVFEQDGNGGINISDGFTNQEKWQAMQSPRTKTNGDGKTDLATMLTANNVSIAAGDSTTVQFVVLVNESETQMIDDYDKAYRTFAYQPTAGADTSLVMQLQANHIAIYPNPIRPMQCLTISAMQQINKVSLINIFNQTIEYQENSSSNIVNFNIGNVASGLHIIDIELSNGNVISKPIMVKE
ncbi:MAG: S8 family peptidase [Salinivirgaceae bacterium]|nr:S8 family peptidase [Salinivirgaceae bacterium]